MTDIPRLMAVNVYFKAVLKGSGRIEASEVVAAAVLGRGVWGARVLRGWANIYFEQLMLPSIRQGCHVKVNSLVHDEDVQEACKAFLRGLKPDSRTFVAWKEFVNQELLPIYANLTIKSGSVDFLLIFH